MDEHLIFEKLAEEFPREQVSWRAQNVAKAGDKALALAYLDSRDVQGRLDDVMTPAGWQNRFEVHGEKTICYLSLKIGDTWITKADGAGDTQVEEEKGALSSALKRSAVLWQVGRYLYSIPSIWVPCDSYADSNGKLRWSKWKADPWDYVKTAPKPQQGLAGGKTAELATDAASPHWTVIAEHLSACTTLKQLNGAFERHRPVYDLLPEHFQQELQTHYYELRATVEGGKPKPAETPPKAASPNFDKLQANDIPLTQAQKLAATL